MRTPSRTNRIRAARPARSGVLWLLAAAAILALLWPALSVPLTSGGRAALIGVVANQHRLVVGTLALALVTGLAGTIGGALLAGVHHRFRFCGRRLLQLMVLSQLLMPPVASAIALLQLWGHNGLAARLLGWHSVPVYGFAGLATAEVMTLLPLAYLVVLGGFSNLDEALIDQARDMGASEAHVLARIVLPRMRGALAGAFLLLVARAAVDITNPLALGGSYPVLSTRLRDAAVGEGDMTAAGAYGLILLVICAVAALAIPGRDHLPVQERLRHRRRVRPSGAAGRALVAAAWLVATVEVLPLVVCAVASVLANAPRLTGGHYVGLFTSDTTRLAIADSLLVAAVVVVAATSIALTVVTVAPRTGPASISRVLLASSTPVLPLALGALHWWRRPVWGAASGWVVLGLVATITTISSTPMMVALLRQRLATMAPQADESAAGLAVRTRRIIGPLIAPHLAAVVPAMLIVTLAEAVTALAPVVLFNGADTPFVATRLITDVEAGQLGQASALAMTAAALLGVLSCCVTVLVAPARRMAVIGIGTLG